MWKPSKDGVSAAEEVDDFDAAVAHLTKCKIKFVLGPMDSLPAARSRFAIPTATKLSLHQSKRRQGK